MSYTLYDRISNNIESYKNFDILKDSLKSELSLMWKSLRIGNS